MKRRVIPSKILADAKLAQIDKSQQAAWNSTHRMNVVYVEVRILNGHNSKVV